MSPIKISAFTLIARITQICEDISWVELFRVFLELWFSQVFDFLQKMRKQSLSKVTFVVRHLIVSASSAIGSEWSYLFEKFLLFIDIKVLCYL